MYPAIKIKKEPKRRTPKTRQTRKARMGCGRRDYPHESKLKKEPKCGGNCLQIIMQLSSTEGATDAQSADGLRPAGIAPRISIKKSQSTAGMYPAIKMKKEPHEFSVNSG